MFVEKNTLRCVAVLEADLAGWKQSQEFLNINIHNEQVQVEKVQKEESHTYSELLPDSTPTTTVTSTTPNSTQNNDDSSDKEEEIETDNGTWNSAVKARNQSYKGSLSLEMEVIIESAKGHHVQLDDRLKRTISSIDQRSGVAPSQATLRDHISQQCKTLGLDNGEVEIKPRLVYYNTEHKLIYVANPKCGSTSFKKFMLKLGGDKREYSEMEEVHNEEKNPLLKSLWEAPLELQKEALRTYYKVTFVRNPLVRLVSGYRNKIVRIPKGHYVDQIQEIIAQNYGVDAALSWMPRRQYRPSFEQFVEYLIYTGNARENYHWAPFADYIGLCGSTVKYDLIAQLETAHQHVEEMKEMVPSLKDIPFPPSRTERAADQYSSEEVTALAFSNLTETLKTGVYKLYEKEIKLLGYSLIHDQNFPFLTSATVHLEDI
ncbi:carbohydrate sulfotransferase 11-like isoform X2 [Bolinopsis microptera]|uniref:carbohydrate sulfotransferase 11-like isoform X2 n=1 Tax=Bolinopsis microptera TaxID=2820187 RepID=UPI003079701F